MIFGIINLVGNFGTVFVDQAYWQSAIAAKPSSSHKGYILGAPFSPAPSWFLPTECNPELSGQGGSC